MECFGYDTFINGVNSNETIGWQHTQFIKRFYRFLIVKNFFFKEKISRRKVAAAYLKIEDEEEGRENVEKWKNSKYIVSKKLMKGIKETEIC